MGRLESLTAWALGRTPYEDQLIEPEIQNTDPNAQQYDEHGHPRNPETKRRERENVRAANEVMQATGIVENTTAMKVAARKLKNERSKETILGLRLMEAGRAVLVSGLWGTFGLRRRILLYRSYSEIGIFQLIQRERAQQGLSRVFFAGFPAALAYLAIDWAEFVFETVLDGIFDENAGLGPIQLYVKDVLQGTAHIICSYVVSCLRIYGLLQQLHLLGAAPLLPSFGSLVPFTRWSPFQRPPNPSANVVSVLSWVVSISRPAGPMIAHLFYLKFKHMISSFLYRPVYKCLPRPKGESMFAGLNVDTPVMQYDSPDAPDGNTSVRGEDEQTLRALEGLPALERTELRSRRYTHDSSETSDEDEGMDTARPPLISFDIDDTATAVQPTYGQWSAELRSANEPKETSGVNYRVTGLTLLPTILAAEGLKDICGAIVTMPIEQLMIRYIAREHRGPDTDFYNIGFKMPSFSNLLCAYAFQFVVTGVIWAGFNVVTEWIVMRRRRKNDDTAAGASADGPFN